MGAVRHTPQSRARVLEEFAKCGRVDLACERVGIDRSTHYNWMRMEPEYAAAFQVARQQAIDYLEDMAHKRATDDDQPSDRLLEFLLKGLRPDVYGDRMKAEHSGPAGGPVQHRVVFVRSDGNGKPEGK